MTSGIWVRDVRPNFFRAGQQMLILSDDALRLEASCVMQRCDNGSENAPSPRRLAVRGGLRRG